MKALIYTRVSKDRRHGRSVEEQETECRDLCDREGWEIVDVLTDNDRSASRHATRMRPAWENVKTAIASGTIDILVTWEASRAQRDLAVYAELRQLCAEHGVKWSYGGSVYDLTTTADRFRTGIDALVSENEAEQTRDRILRTFRASAQKGRPHGRRPYGYRRVYDSDTGAPRQEIDPVESLIVLEAARRVLAGESTYAIAADLRARDVPTMLGGRWDGGAIRRMLINPAVAGLRTHRGVLVGDAEWPGIVDAATRDRLLAVLADPSRRTHRTGEAVHLLTSCLRCGVCGGKMDVGRTRGSGSAFTYRCKAAGHVTRNRDQLDRHVTAYLLRRFSRPDAADLTSDRPAPEVETALAEVVDLRSRLAEAFAAWQAKDLSAAGYGQMESTLLPAIAAAERRARVVHLPVAVHELALSDDVEATWEAMPDAAKRAVMAAMVVVTVRPTVKRGPGFDPSTVDVEVLF